MYYFKAVYTPGLGYSQNWYATLAYTPPATVLLYDDNLGYCIGYMESELPQTGSIMAMAETEALEIVNNAVESDGIWFGDKLLHRWDGPIIPNKKWGERIG